MVCVKCGNELGRVMLHGSNGPSHLVCPQGMQAISDFEALMLPPLLIPAGERNVIGLYRVKKAVDRLITAHNQLVGIVEHRLQGDLRAVPEKDAPLPRKSPNEALATPRLVRARHSTGINNPADAYDFLVQLHYVCTCFCPAARPHPKCHYKMICKDCRKPLIEREVE